MKPAKADELDGFVSFAEVPLKNEMVAKDKSQGGFVIDLLEREKRESGGERLFFEVRREHSTNFGYPKFIFDRSPGASDDDLFLVGYAGLMNFGDAKVRTNINYSYMFLMNIAPASDEKTKSTSPSPTPETK